MIYTSLGRKCFAVWLDASSVRVESRGGAPTPPSLKSVTTPVQLVEAEVPHIKLRNLKVLRERPTPPPWRILWGEGGSDLTRFATTFGLALYFTARNLYQASAPLTNQRNIRVFSQEG